MTSQTIGLQAVQQRGLEHLDAGEHPLRHRALGRARRARVEDADHAPGRVDADRAPAPRVRIVAQQHRRRRAAARRAPPAAPADPGRRRPWRSSPAPARARGALAPWRCRRRSRAAPPRPSTSMASPDAAPVAERRRTRSPRWKTLTTARGRPRPRRRAQPEARWPGSRRSGPAASAAPDRARRGASTDRRPEA